MVTQIKSSDVRKKSKTTAAKSADSFTKSSSAKARRSLGDKAAVEDAAYKEAGTETSRTRQSAAAKLGLSQMVARGKDIVSGDATSVATAAAIVVGAALIEVKLIPGLVIGAGAVLLGKLFPEMTEYVRPAIKEVLRAGFSMAQKAQVVMAETSEQVHDLVAEVKLEQKQAHVAKTTKASASDDLSRA